jgi:DNA-binding CsgD family transcriptional regulator
MENDKPTYEQIEKELDEYKELLWQLSDEYKVNLGAAEKKLEEERIRLQELEKEIENRKDTTNVTISESVTPEIEEVNTSNDILSQLGLPACILDGNGKIIKHNNKFKFLVELIGFEIEELENISVLFVKNKIEGLQEKFNKYVQSDDGVLQSLYKVENQFQSLVNLVIRVYRNADDNQHLALFVELSANEIVNLGADKEETVTEKKVETPKKLEPSTDIVPELKTEIAIFTEKYELLDEILKFEELSKEKNELNVSLTQSLKRSFNLEILRNKILEKLQAQFKTFIFQINQKYPELTNNEEKHCMLVKAGLSYKEIAALMGVSINGVKIARNRLRKKFDLENETKTSDFIEGIL